MRYIDADKLRKDVLDLPNCYNGYSDTYDKAMIIDLIDEQPTVDAIEVVRCKDCDDWIGDHCRELRYGDPNGYCAWAEREEDAEEE